MDTNGDDGGRVLSSVRTLSDTKSSIFDRVKTFDSDDGGGTFDRVVSVYERLLEKLKKQRDEEEGLQPNEVPSSSHPLSETFGTREGMSTMTFRRHIVSVSLAVLAQMRLSFDLFEWRHMMRRNKVLYCADMFTYERNSDEEVAAMFRYKQQQEKYQELVREARDNNSYCAIGGGAGAYFGAISGAPPGMPFQDFECDIVEPFFEVFFPYGGSQRASYSAGVENESVSLGVQSKLTGKFTVGQPPPQITYQRRRASHVEVAESLFRVIDTNGDGFVSWDELSGFLLQSGQRSALSGSPKEGFKGSASPFSQAQSGCENEESADYAVRQMKFTPIPCNNSIWQRRFPLVRFLYHKSSISHMIVVDNNRRYVTAAWDGLVKLWRTDPRMADSRGQPAIVHERNLFAAGVPIIDMVLAPPSLGNSEVLAVLAMDGTITLLRFGTGEVVKTFLGRTFTVHCTANDSRGSPPSKRKVASHTETGKAGVAATSDTLEDALGVGVVMRPEYKVRAYRREVLDMFTTDVSCYFSGISTVAPTYEHLEKPREMKVDLLLDFGESTRLTAADVGVKTRQRSVFSLRAGNTPKESRGILSDTCSPREEKKSAPSSPEKDGHSLSEAGQRSRLQGHTAAVRLIPDCGDADLSVLCRTVCLTKFERTSSAFILPSGALLFAGFSTGLLQCFHMQVHWFNTNGLTRTRMEPTAKHRPVVTLRLHRAAITRIVVSEEHDVLMTMSDDSTVVVRHMSRVQVPFLTLGGTTSIPILLSSCTAAGSVVLPDNQCHTKRITCAAWCEWRSLLVTGSLDRSVVFWTPSSSRPIHHIDLNKFGVSSSATGYPVDLSFIQPPHQPLLLLVVDSVRVLYFFDAALYTCMHMIRDDSPASQRTGQMLCARYDACFNRIVLGGHHLRVWNIQQSDSFLAGYCGHQREVVGLVYQKRWGFWVSADDSVIIIWHTSVVNGNDVEEYATLNEGDKPGCGEERGNPQAEKQKEVGEASLKKDERKTEGLRDRVGSYSISGVVDRSWVVEGGICCLAVEQTESARIFVALANKRCIEEYNSFSGVLLRSFAFADNCTEASSIACSFFAGKGSLRQPCALLCGTFERERSSNGTTALYLLQDGAGDAPMRSSSKSSDAHRYIFTTGVGVSFAMINEATETVVIGHRGGVSITPLEEATKCPILCVRLTDVVPERREMDDPVTDDKPPGQRSSHVACRNNLNVLPQSISESTSASAGPRGDENVKASFAKTLRGQVSPSREITQPVVRHFRPSPPVDLVALLPGPPIPDPIEATREYMLNRERYLFHKQNANRSTSFFGEVFGDPREVSLDDASGSRLELDETDRPPLLLFSGDFDPAHLGCRGNIDFFLHAHLGTLGFVEHIQSIGKTIYLVSGSDDGLMQFWNSRTLTEVMRFRVTYALDAVVSLDVSPDASYILTVDSSGYLSVLDIGSVDWESEVPLEMAQGVESDVMLLQRWLVYPETIRSIRFVSSHSTLASTKRPLQVFGCTHAFNETKNAERDVDVRADSCQFDATASDVKLDILFCTCSEEGYIRVWCWRFTQCVNSFGHGKGPDNVHCIGCFGVGAESPARPLLTQLADNSWRILEVVRKAYVDKRLLPLVCASTGCVDRAGVNKAENFIREEMLSAKISMRCSHVPAHRSSSPRRSYKGPKGRSSKCSNLSDPGEFPTMEFYLHDDNDYYTWYVMAFEEGLYYEKTLRELLKRLFKEVVTGGRTRRLASISTVRPAEFSRSAIKRLSTFSKSIRDDASYCSTVLIPELRCPPFLPPLTGAAQSIRGASDSHGEVLHSANRPRFAANSIHSHRAASSRLMASFSPAPASLQLPEVEPWAGRARDTVGATLLPPLRCATGEDRKRRKPTVHCVSEHSSPFVPHFAASTAQAVSITYFDTTERPKSPSDTSINAPNSALAGTKAICSLASKPLINVSYASATPLPRLNRALFKDVWGRVRGKRFSGSLRKRTEVRAFLTSAIAGPGGRRSLMKLECRYGVKILLGEKVSKQEHISKFLGKREPSVVATKGIVTVSALIAWSQTKDEALNPAEIDDVAAIRLKRKREAIQWNHARLMKTLLNWKAPCNIVDDIKRGSTLCHSVVSVNSIQNLCKASDAATPVLPFQLPPLLPADSEAGRGVAVKTPEIISHNKNVTMLLERETAAMNAILMEACNERDRLIAQSTMSLPSLGNGGSVFTGL